MSSSQDRVYDTVHDAWLAATPIPGPGVFGHGGAIWGDTLVYADGVRVAGLRFVMSTAGYRGIIDPTDPTTIDWRELAPHPGPPKYRMAAGAWDGRIYFSGGSDDPYNFDGIGYDRNPSEPDGETFAYNLRTDLWERTEAQSVATMDHRALVPCGDALIAMGGMEAGQVVSGRVARLGLASLSPFVRVPDAPVGTDLETSIGAAWSDFDDSLPYVGEGSTRYRGPGRFLVRRVLGPGRSIAMGELLYESYPGPFNGPEGRVLPLGTRQVLAVRVDAAAISDPILQHEIDCFLPEAPADLVIGTPVTAAATPPFGDLALIANDLIVNAVGTQLEIMPPRYGSPGVPRLLAERGSPPSRARH